MSQNLISLIQFGRETRNVEFKTTYDWNNPQHKAKIVKTILGMSNVRDGGHLILGVEEINDSFIPRGMSQNDWDLLNQDDVMAHVNNFADPYVEFTVHKIQHDGMLFVIFEIDEFKEIPVVCKRQGEQGLKQGTLFTRSRRMAETVAVPSQSEMREILDIAIEKGVRKFQERISRTGLIIQSESTDENRFNAELEGL
ncbi:ATP-binding protein [Bacillus thuringiensis]|uniref:Schlafen AlbA-2 domain-containing protein n=1 Tax=Bacillus thuringiensis TaxID=1428 RepID=A0ABD6SGX3_BACTU|nr:ATP-binding protein [Bacillus thuringiensis]PEX44006.1 hypothetical protein CN461_27955 [Bacillus thuringiensis]PFN84549.1 hypothetical protein COJ76_21555 [Bacillus thuringiensis]PGO19966.1 hypothetical protein CN974_08545 [Bacillus thuringiensis]